MGFFYPFLRYIPTLIGIVDRFCKYNARYQVTIRNNLPDGMKAPYEALLVACDVFMAAVATVTGEGHDH